MKTLSGNIQVQPKTLIQMLHPVMSNIPWNRTRQQQCLLSGDSMSERMWRHNWDLRCNNTAFFSVSSDVDSCYMYRSATLQGTSDNQPLAGKLLSTYNQRWIMTHACWLSAAYHIDNYENPIRQHPSATQNLHPDATSCYVQHSLKSNTTATMLTQRGQHERQDVKAWLRCEMQKKHSFQCVIRC